MGDGRVIRDATAPELASAETFDRFLEAFRIAAIPKVEWTHAAHLTMACGYLQRHGLDTLGLVRDGIRKLNAAHGLIETPERGYHESLTRFWLHVCEAFLQESGLRGVEAVRALIAVYASRAHLYREFYSFDVVRSAARQEWIPPDLKPLPAAWRHGELLISTNSRLLQLGVAHEMISKTYWADGIPRHLFDRSVRNSLAFGVYEGGRQIGFCRVVTDYATYGWLADVVIAEPCRGRGLSKWLVECVRAHPGLQGFRRWHLATRDAHDLYRRYGFDSLSDPGRMMEILRRNPYDR